MDKGSLAERLTELSAARRIDVTELSRASGLKEGAIYKLLRGDQKSTSLQTGLRLAEALGVDPSYLAFGKARPTDVSLALVDGTKIEVTIAASGPSATGAREKLTTALRGAASGEGVLAGASVKGEDAAPRVVAREIGAARKVTDVEALQARVEALERQLGASDDSQEPPIRRRLQNLEKVAAARGDLPAPGSPQGRVRPPGAPAARSGKVG